MAKAKDKQPKIDSEIVSAVMSQMGRLGGKRTVPKGLASMDPEKALKIRRAGAQARWEKWRAENPEKAAASKAKPGKRARPAKKP